MDNDRPIYPYLPEPLRSIAIEAHDAMHCLWSRAPRDAYYDKQSWRRLEAAIDALVKEAKR